MIKWLLRLIRRRGEEKEDPRPLGRWIESICDEEIRERQRRLRARLRGYDVEAFRSTIGGRFL